MQIKVLGSGSSEGIPTPFCRCKICQNAKGRGIRLRSSYWVRIGSVDLLVEASPDLRQQILKNHFDYRHLDYLFLSHRHFDHTYGLADLRQCLILARGHGLGKHKIKRTILLGEDFHSWLTKGQLNGWYHEGTQRAFADLVKHQIFEPLVLKPFQEVELNGGIFLTFLSGPHGDINSGGFVLKKGRKGTAYLGDMGQIPAPVGELLAKVNPDLVIAHCPFFHRPSEKREKGKHLGIEDLVEVPGKKILLSHFSHSARLSHQKMVKGAQRLDGRFVVAYDGLEVRL